MTDGGQHGDGVAAMLGTHKEFDYIHPQLPVKH